MHFTLITTALQQFIAHNGITAGADIFRLSLPPEKKLGDICINIFAAVKPLGCTPVILGEKLLDFMRDQPFVTDGNIIGGFVNLMVTDELYSSELAGWSLPVFERKNETIIVDYMGANIGKPLHIAHLCTPLYGQATINLLRTMGYEVTADMHQGDWGGIFGKLITGWKYFGNQKAFEENPVRHLFDIYVAITKKSENEPEVEQECRDAFRLLSKGDVDSMKLWQQFTDKSLAGVRTVMNEFRIHPDIWIGESFYEGLPLPKLGNWPDLTPDNTMSSVVDELVEKSIATKNEDGSVGIIFDPVQRAKSIEQSSLPLGMPLGISPEQNEGIDNDKSVTLNFELGTLNSKLPSCILQKKDGTHGYLASDLAAIKYRLKNWSPARIIYFVDNRQALHFKQLFTVAKTAWIQNAETDELKNGGTEKLVCDLTHAANGFVTLPEGAMSTRHGIVIFLEDLIVESFDRVKKILIERERNISDDDIKSVAHGAIVYSFLSQDREKDWIFEWDKVLAFEGNSGPYLQYTFVRWKKVLDEIAPLSRGVPKVGGLSSGVALINGGTEKLTAFDRDLIIDILSFRDILIAAGTTYKFHLLIAHITAMARHLNALYVNTPKLRDTIPEERNERIRIVSLCLAIISYTCAIVNIPLPEEM